MYVAADATSASIINRGTVIGGNGAYLGTGVLTNGGTIAGGGAAGAVFSGSVVANASIADVLQLAYGATAGTLTGLGSQFIDLAEGRGFYPSITFCEQTLGLVSSGSTGTSRADRKDVRRMPQFLTAEPPEAVLATLSEALDLVDFGIVLLNRDMRVRFVNRHFVENCGLPQELLAGSPSLRDLLDHVARNSRYAVPPEALGGYLDQREAAVRAGAIAPTDIDLTDGRRMQFRCITCPDGGRMLTYTDITRIKQEQELQLRASDEAERMGVELRFSNETLEGQASYLASLAETAEDNAQRAEEARRELEREVAERRELERQLRRMATTDALTGVLNRAQVLALGQKEMERARRLEQGLAVLMIDVDHFKSINDKHGHATGDEALKHLVGRLLAGVRRIDLIGRLGGEEFAVVLPSVTPEAAWMVAERLRAGIAVHPLRCESKRINMTVSIGLSMERRTDRTVEQVLARADAQLYRAKDGGRNRVCQDEGVVAA